MKIYLGVFPSERNTAINLYSRHGNILMSYFFIQQQKPELFDGLLADFSYHKDLLLWKPKRKK